jgi:predicted RecB family nuclease
MQLREGRPLLFATDLTNFLGCRHLAALERLAAHRLARRPFRDDPMLDLLRERGLAHERAYVEALASAGKRVVHIDRHSADALGDTLAAMRGGADAIVQARLEDGAWAGWSDVLLRAAGESRFGPWCYEPVETKLATETRGATLVQLCLYAELLAALQGAVPELLRVVVPGTGFEPERHRFAEYRAYFRLVRRQYEASIAGPLPPSVEAAPPYPEPVPHCDVCAWYPQCGERWHRDDHLSLVAGLQRLHRNELASWGVAALADLARLPLPLERRPVRGSVAALTRAREQARLQLEARTTGRPTHELLPLAEGEGLAALPAPSALDVFLDLEGDRLAEDGGFEYLFGYAVLDAEGRARYTPLWALSRAEEKAAFERLMDVVAERRARDPGMHVYHYAPYEPTAMKRLMGRYATRADELDELLRGEVFVDLYAVVRKALRAGVESYSIKQLEPLYGLERKVDLRAVSRLLRTVEYAVATGAAAALGAEAIDAVAGYNRDDCLSALALRDWLEALRAEEERRRGAPIPRPIPPESRPPEQLGERLARAGALAQALTADLPLARSRDEQARWVLAQLLAWHRREDKVAWWELFRLDGMSEEELLDERDGIAGLEHEQRLRTTSRGTVVDRYRFPPQDTDVSPGDELLEPGKGRRSRFATVEALDAAGRTIDLRKGRERADRHPRALFRHDAVSNRDAEEALFRLGELVRDRGLDGPGPQRAARDLLLRRNPRLAPGIPLRLEGESTLASARRAVLALDGGVLAVQGPPGAGKTYGGARMIVDLARAGKRVGVTAVSHKVIRNLLDEVVRAAAEEGAAVRCMQRVPEESGAPDAAIDEETDAAGAVARILGGGCDVAGGTAWLWSRPDLAEALDVLFVDEAGQMSLANVLACAQAARNLVLLGDPQQLEQPQRAAHPDGCEVSALEHLLEGHDTIPAERGLFLDVTRRLHPAICAFTSELFYEGRLAPHEALALQRVSGPTPFAGAGLFHVPVAHEGSRNASAEEAECVAAIVNGLVAPGVTWTDCHGVVRPLRLEDVLVVAPYNAQVGEIAERLPGARVGTVDRFQGQEAPVVVYSMATSSAEEAPRGMEFLYDRHRLNVAISRARCVAIVVASPRLFEPECRTPAQMRMANAYCRYLELATVVPAAEAGGRARG